MFFFPDNLVRGYKREATIDLGWKKSNQRGKKTKMSVREVDCLLSKSCGHRCQVSSLPPPRGILLALTLIAHTTYLSIHSPCYLIVDFFISQELYFRRDRIRLGKKRFV